MSELIHTLNGQILSESEAQDRIRRTIERTGRFLLSSPWEPVAGEIQEYAGLPMRFVRLVTQAEYDKDCDQTQDIWGDLVDEDDGCLFHFEVEVAD